MLPDITLDCKKQCLFYTWGHRPMNRSIIIFNLSFFTHSHYFWNRTEFSTSSTNTCPVRISNTTSSLAVSVTKRNSLVLFHFSFITESEQKKKTNIPSHLSTGTCPQLCICAEQGFKKQIRKTNDYANRISRHL